MTVRVTLYTRARCHLCDLARQAIAAAGCADLYVLEEVDVDRVDVLRERYTNDVPVVALDGVDIFWHHVDPSEFCRLVASPGAANRGGAES